MLTLALPSDVEDIWRPLSPPEVERVFNLIAIASAKLRRAVSFSIDDRVTLYATDPDDVKALDPIIVANVVATIVKRFMVNVGGLTTSSESVGPYSISQSFSKTAADGLVVTADDIDQLTPASVRRRIGMIQLAPTQAMQPASGWWAPGEVPTDPNTGEPLNDTYDAWH